MLTNEILTHQVLLWEYTGMNTKSTSFLSGLASPQALYPMHISGKHASFKQCALSPTVSCVFFKDKTTLSLLSVLGATTPC